MFVKENCTTQGRAKVFMLLIFGAVTLHSTWLSAQANRMYFEAPIVYKNGQTLSTQITVNFKARVFDLAPNRGDATIADVAPAFPQVKAAFQDLEKSLGTIAFKKQIPAAVWGDVWRTNRVTGEQVRIHEWSQLFYVVFDGFVPIDSIVGIVKKLPEIDYAHGPICAASDVDPNDPRYLDGSQWNLAKVKTSSAWDISQGSTALRIGIVEVDGTPNRNHIDFWTGPGTTGTSKFDGGDTGGDAFHASQVAGIVGAATNDGDGIASLGWKLIMRPYTFTSNAGSSTTPGTLANAMSRAINDTCHVINCSFTLYTTNFQQMCGGCQLYDPAGINTYPEVRDLFNDAFNANIIVITSMGNTGFNRIKNPGHPDCQNCPTVPFNAYPASYPGVIGVTATDSNDDVPNNYNQSGIDGTPFIDLAAPGIGVLSTGTGNGHFTASGSSFSAPLVAALAGLMKSIKSDLNPGQAESILKSSVDVINEPPHYAGAGRANAYQALLLTHAYSNKSMSIAATATNSGRRMVKTSDGRYHLVFESGIISGGNVLSEIYYRRSNVGGTSWETPVRLSNGDEQNRYPSIAERVEGANKRLYVVWQRKTGTNTYDILFRHYTGTSWETIRNVTGSISSSNDLLPAIAVSIPTGSIEIMVAYRTGSGLKSKKSISTNGATWLAEKMIISNTGARNPSLVYIFASAGSTVRRG